MKLNNDSLTTVNSNIQFKFFEDGFTEIGKNFIIFFNYVFFLLKYTQLLNKTEKVEEYLKPLKNNVPYMAI